MLCTFWGAKTLVILMTSMDVTFDAKEVESVLDHTIWQVFLREHGARVVRDGCATTLNTIRITTARWNHLAILLMNGSMDATLQSHGAKHIFPVPGGLRELAADISREVLRVQPENIYGFIADYCDALLKAREAALVAGDLVGDMLSHQVTYDALLVKRGVTMDEANRASIVIQAAFRGYLVRKYTKFVPGPPKDPVLDKLGIDRELAEKATIKIQAAFRGYVVRKSFLGAARAYGDQLDKFGGIFNILNKSYLSEGAAEAAAARLKVALGSLDAVSGDATASEASVEELRAERVPDHIPVGKELLYVEPTEEDLILKADDKAEADKANETEG